MLYAASIFLGAAFAFAFFDRAGYRQWMGGAAGVLVAGAWVYLLTFALYSLPAPLARVAERLESVRNPFTATNDQLAIITWFQESAPAGGYGMGAVPWCGEIAGAGCRGVPRQIQSDYVFTALVGVYGKAVAVGLVALLAFWLVRRRDSPRPRDARDRRARLGSRHAAGLVELDRGVLGRPHARPARHHGRGQRRAGCR